MGKTGDRIANAIGTISPLGGLILHKGAFGKVFYGNEDDDKDKVPGGPMSAAAAGPANGGSAPTMRKGGKVKKMAKGGSTASKRADGCATKGKTKGRFV